MSKRPSQQNLSDNTTKKVNKGIDLPSSSSMLLLAAQKKDVKKDLPSSSSLLLLAAQKSSQQQSTQQGRQQQSTQKSVIPSKLIQKNPMEKIQQDIQKKGSSALSSLKLPEKFKNLLEPDEKELLKYKEKKKMKEKILQKLIDQGSIPNPKEYQLKLEEEEKLNQMKASLKVYQDEKGKLIDSEGNIIIASSNSSKTSLFNLKKEKEERVKQMIKIQKQVSREINLKNAAIYDANVNLRKKSKRDKKATQAFKFIEKGTITKKAEEYRIKKNLNEGYNDSLQTLLMNNKERFNSLNFDAFDVESNPIEKAAIQRRWQTSNRMTKLMDNTPNVEWWDQEFLPKGQKYYTADDKMAQFEAEFDAKKEITDEIKKEFDDTLDMPTIQSILIHQKYLDYIKQNQQKIRSQSDSVINCMIEHPFPFKLITQQDKQTNSIPMYLTREERKKINRRKRQEKEKEKQDKIKLGLLPPQQPKVKLSNMMKVFTSEAVADPSKVEQNVREAIADRLKKHLERNEARKLTKEQKHQKIQRQYQRDKEKETRVALFRIEDLTENNYGLHRFKVDINAQQLQLHGVCIINVDKKTLNQIPSVIYVEGGPKAIKFYKKLLLNRIKWEKPSRKKNDKEDENERQQLFQTTNKCSLVWEGVQQKHIFKKWSVVDISTQSEAKKIFQDKGLESYWNYIMAYNPDQ